MVDGIRGENCRRDVIHNPRLCSESLNSRSSISTRAAIRGLSEEVGLYRNDGFRLQAGTFTNAEW